MTAVEGPSTIRELRRAFWANNEFGSDGGYDEPWAHASFATIPYAVPNYPARGDALRVHDLHHVLTSYETDWRGESEIAAWELGSGGGGLYPYAWFIAVFGFVVGLLALPVRTFRAFMRGRRWTNLYRARRPLRVLDLRQSQARALLLRVARPRPFHSVLLFGALAVALLPLGILFLLGTPLLVAAAMTRVRCPLRSTMSTT